MRENGIKMITWLSLISFLVWMVGLGWVILDQFFARAYSQVPEPVSEMPAGKEEHFTILSLGDSLTRGTGDAAGKGYVGYLAETLEKKYGIKPTLYNLGINGQRSAQLLRQLDGKEVQRQIGQAQVITITIGGNDLFRGGQTLLEINEEEIAKLQEEYLGNLDQILKKIRSVNPEAVIFQIGLYNPFIELDDGRLTSKIVREWNYRTAEVCAIYPRVVFVPTFDLFELHVNDYLYTDKFHPNTEGYRLIAERVASLITWMEESGEDE